jgi:alpha-L-fucosidase 2
VAGAESNIFSLDGNTAGAAGVAEMLLQSQGGEIHLLPALPSAWPSGNIMGLCARGGVEVSLSWAGGKLIAASLKSKRGGTHKVRYGDKVMQITLSAGRSHTVYPRDFQSA